jgi:hypothetical protein
MTKKIFSTEVKNAKALLLIKRLEKGVRGVECRLNVANLVAQNLAPVSGCFAPSTTTLNVETRKGDVVVQNFPLALKVGKRVQEINEDRGA